MTDALAKDDADHVLASIRRLVSDRPAPAAATDRFLLTPALRVVETAPKPLATPKFLHEAAALGEALHISQAVAQTLHGVPPVTAPVSSSSQSDYEDANDSVADDQSIARLLRGLARSEAPAILAETLAEACGIAATEALSGTMRPKAAPIMLLPEAAVTSDLRSAVHAPAPPPVLQTPVAQAPIAQDPAPALPQSALADEAFLREIVGDVLRQELQGELGERITRNMRKLVRREIHRALSQLDGD